MAIRVVRNENGNCVTFVGSSQPAYWNACLSGRINDDDNTRIDVVNDIRTTDPDSPIFEFFGVPYTEFQDADGNSFDSADDAAEYITLQANVISGATRFEANDSVDFSRDSTQTSVVTSTGDSFGVNSIKATAESDGTISIKENVDNGVALYTSIRHTNVTIGSQSQSRTLNTVVNALNSLFTVTPVGAGADDPFSSFLLLSQSPTISGFGDVTIDAGVATKGTNTGSQFNDGFYSSSLPLSSSGEYFYLNNTGYDFERKFIIGLLETSKFTDASTLEAITTSGELLDLAVRLGPNTAYENSDYGVVIEKGFYEKPKNSDEFRAGIDSDSRLFVSHYVDGEWQVIVRSAFPVDTDNEEYMLVCMMNKEGSQFSTSTIVSKSLSSNISLEYHYIESPDGSFYYPLFNTQEEADLVSQNAFTIFGSPYVDDTDVNSEGTYSHSHVFVDDESGTTWYMPDNYAFEGESAAPLNTDDITYTAITTADDSLYAPAEFSGSDYTFNENVSVNVCIQTASSYTQTLSGLPIELSYNSGTGCIMGTTRYVPESETHTVTVTRTNNFGSSSGTFDIIINDNASLGDLSHFTETYGNFVQPNRAILSHDFVMQYDTTLSPGEQLTYSYSSGNPPTIGILNTSGQADLDAFDPSTDTLGATSTYDFARTDKWDLRYVSFSGYVGGDSSELNLVGWADNTTLTGTNENLGVEFKLEYSSSDNYIRLYRNDVLLKTSASTFSGPQTLTFAGFDDQAQTDLYVPSNLVITSIGAGTTTAPTGFESPILAGEMGSTTLLGNPDGSVFDSAVQITDQLDINHRFIFPQTWIEANVLPYVQDDGNDVYIGVPTSSPSYGDVGGDDFDVLFKIEGTADSTHKSNLKTSLSSYASVTIASLTDAYYDYALEWDGEDLHVIACNINDINTQPGVSDGGSFSRVMTYSGYGTATGTTNQPLDVVIGVDDGGQANLATSGLQNIRIPFNSNTILVGESSAGNGQFGQVTSDQFDVTGQHAPGTLSYNAPTVNAGYTYKFVYDPSMESDDFIEFRLASDNTTVYTTGVTTFGSGDPSESGAYKGVTFVIPSDVPPLRVYYYNGFSSSYDSGRDLPISGSTYVAPITGITREGPVANQTGTNVMDAGEHGWISLDEPLGAGERLVLDNAFMGDFLGETQGNNTIFAIGLKGDNWANTTEINSNGAGAAVQNSQTFKGNTYIVGVWSSSASSVTMWLCANGVLGNSMLMNSSSLFGTACAFLEITGSGNNIRGGFGRNNSTGSITQGDESTVTYADWNAYKGQTGDQGYGISNIDVVMSFWTYGGGAIDGDQIDWTGLSEIAIPTPAATLTTDWNKALDFSGSSERTQQVTNDSNRCPIMMGGVSSVATGNATAGKTTDYGSGRPWATAIVFSSDNNSSNQHIWNLGEGAGSTDDNIYLRVDANRNLYFGWGRSGALNECSIGTLASGAGNWHGVYIAHTGERLSGTNATATNLAGCFDIRFVDLSTGVAGSQKSVSSNWSTTGGRMDRQILGQMTIGGRGSNRNFHGKVASMVVTTLSLNVNLPDSTEISMMVRDPMQWLQDYKVGNDFRLPWQASNAGFNFSLNDGSSSYSTQVWLMGDGTNDAYAQIRNQVSPATQNYTPMNMISMVSNDIESVTITGLT